MQIRKKGNNKSFKNLRVQKLLDNIFLFVEVTELRLMYKLTQKEIHFNMKSECL